MQVLKYVFFAIQVILLIAIAILFVRLLCYIKNLPEDEVLGEERAKKLNSQMKILFICIGAVCTLSIIQTILRFFNY